jgi:ArsR family metal-binding transcriptional regulator
MNLLVLLYVISLFKKVFGNFSRCRRQEMDSEQVLEADKLVHGYNLELIEPPCVPGAAHWSAKAHIEDNIAELLPYLNAEFKKARYYPDSNALILDYERKKCSFRPHEIAAAPFDDREYAIEFMDNLVNFINNIWGKRKQIEPSFEQREPPRTMDILKLLPGTNCKECGYLTCMAFANQLREGREDVSKCTQLSEQNREKLLRLLNMV